MTLTCDAKIRPFPDDTEITCTKDDKHNYHSGIILNQAYPGSETTITWYEKDRRNYHGEWPGKCEKTNRCPLPDEHHGSCVV